MESEKTSYIRDVWHDNLETEMANIREMIVNYPVISMDTEFPGVVAKPIGSFKSSSDFHYQTLRCNVDLLKIIQLGLTFSTDEGELAPGVCTYQFNFKFSLGEDIYAQDSIDLLTRSGIDFRRHDDYGIDVVYFAELFISSGCVLTDEVKWVSFHSGYDFGYLMKILTCKRLPAEEDDFFSELKLYFPTFYDIKYLMKACEGLKGGLNKLAEDLEVERIGPEHQAGSDSLLTQATFYKMRALFFEGEMDDERHMNILYGLERGANLVKGVRETVNLNPSSATNASSASGTAATATGAAAPTGGGTSGALPFEESSA
uniref:poly(A)-specific ribonuclease n=1 Tax=Haptolina brevifila TaxID=156173 RepID=A0A7S2HV17_9EUKA|mmetsp:Transcript_57972/g.115086  ORF Transcript_57972/g.115086 Transcript_57972/m.115086 type:complete len:316 (+) Transcript_57972:119-1066(+)